MVNDFISDQEDRSRSVDQFRKGEKDVLVATDVASKGLDFPNIQHVINFDMPDDIENYGEDPSIYLLNSLVGFIVVLAIFLQCEHLPLFS